MRTDKIRKYLIPNIPYLFILWAFLKLGTAYRLAAGNDFAHKLIGLGQTIGPAFADFAPGLVPLDWLVGIVGAVGFRLLIYFKSKNAKKFRRDIAIAEACPAHLCSPLRTETENAKRSFGFFITTTAGKPISGKLPRHSLLQGNGAFCQKWEQKTPRIFKNLWRCCLEQYSILVSRSLFWVKEKDNRFWLSCENVYYVVLCKIDKIKFEDHSSTKYLYAAASSSPHSLSKLPFSS